MIPIFWYFQLLLFVFWDKSGINIIERLTEVIYNSRIWRFNIKVVRTFCCSLQDRQLVRNLCRAGQRPNYPETNEVLIPVFRKLHSQGITEEDEDKLLFLKEIIVKLHRAKTR